MKKRFSRIAILANLQILLAEALPFLQIYFLQILKAAHSRPLPSLALIKDLLMQMASALHHLHGRGIAHMDVKPDNIYTTEDGRFKLGDFGLATSLWGRKDLDVQEGDAR